MVVTEKEEKLMRELDSCNEQIMSVVERLKGGISLAEEIIKTEKKLKETSVLLSSIGNLIKSFSITQLATEPKRINNLEFKFDDRIYGENRDQISDLVTDKVFLAYIVMYKEKLSALLDKFQKLTDTDHFVKSEKFLEKTIRNYVYS